MGVATTHRGVAVGERAALPTSARRQRIPLEAFGLAHLALHLARLIARTRLGNVLAAILLFPACDLQLIAPLQAKVVQQKARVFDGAGAARLEASAPAGAVGSAFFCA